MRQRKGEWWGGEKSDYMIRSCLALAFQGEPVGSRRRLHGQNSARNHWLFHWASRVAAPLQQHGNTHISGVATPRVFSLHATYARIQASGSDGKRPGIHAPTDWLCCGGSARLSAYKQLHNVPTRDGGTCVQRAAESATSRITMHSPLLTASCAVTANRVSFLAFRDRHRQETCGAAKPLQIEAAGMDSSHAVVY